MSRLPRWVVAGLATFLIVGCGVTGDDRAPGPSTYWIDAVVILEPGVAERLREDASLERDPVSAGVGPLDPVPDVAAKVPEGEPVGSRALNAAFSAEELSIDARLVEGRDVIVLSVLAQ